MIFCIDKTGNGIYIPERVLLRGRMTEIEEKIKVMKEAASVIYDHGWGEASAGNMSILIDEKVDFNRSNKISLKKKFIHLKNRSILITASGTRMRQISSGVEIKMFSHVTLDHNGGSYYCHPDFSGRPSSELIAHLMMHDILCRENKNDNAVIHCHPDSIITLLRSQKFKDQDALNEMFSEVLLESKLLLPNGAGILDDMEPGSEKLASAICKQIKKRDIVLLDKHGCFSHGKDMDEALDRIEFVEKAARIYLELIKLKYEEME